MKARKAHPLVCTGPSPRHRPAWRVSPPLWVARNGGTRPSDPDHRYGASWIGQFKPLTLGDVRADANTFQGIFLVSQNLPPIEDGRSSARVFDPRVPQVAS